MKRIAILLFLAVLSLPLFAKSQSPEEQQIWKLEHDYWKYVQASDLTAYRNLWHPNFIGWPLTSAAPVRKDHITDWIKLHSDKGEHLSSFEVKEAGSQLTDNIVVTHYWLRATWTNKAGASTSVTTRVTHTWVRAKDGWQIIGGMSAPEPDAP